MDYFNRFWRYDIGFTSEEPKLTSEEKPLRGAPSGHSGGVKSTSKFEI